MWLLPLILILTAQLLATPSSAGQKEDWKAHKPECKMEQGEACASSSSTGFRVFKVSGRDVHVVATPQLGGSLGVLLWDREEGIPFTRLSSIMDETALLPRGSMQFYMKVRTHLVTKLANGTCQQHQVASSAAVA